MTSSLKKLVVHGEPPVRLKMLPYGRQWLYEEDIAAVVEVLRSDTIDRRFAQADQPTMTGQLVRTSPVRG